jgi:hypothetical protein
MLCLVDAGGNYATIPLLRDVPAAGPPAEVNESDVESWAIIYKDTRWLPHGAENYTCIRVRRKGMYPILDNGDIVAIDYSARPTDIEHLKRLNGKIVVFRVNSGVIIKWLKFLEDKRTVIGTPENHSELGYAAMLQGDEINQSIVGVVRWWWSKR